MATRDSGSLRWIGCWAPCLRQWRDQTDACVLAHSATVLPPASPSRPLLSIHPSPKYAWHGGCPHEHPSGWPWQWGDVRGVWKTGERYGGRLHPFPSPSSAAASTPWPEPSSPALRRAVRPPTRWFLAAPFALQTTPTVTTPANLLRSTLLSAPRCFSLLSRDLSNRQNGKLSPYVIHTRHTAFSRAEMHISP